LRIYAVSPTEMELIPIAAASSYITPDGSMSWQYWNSLILE